MPIQPPVLWAQRRDKVFLTVDVADAKNDKINLDDKKLTVSFTGGPDQKEFLLELEFFEDIDPASSKYVVTPRNIAFQLAKKETKEEHWPRLLKDKAKHPNISIDWNRWKDEDEDEGDEEEDSQFAGMPGMGGGMDMEAFQRMMSQQGGFGGDDEGEEDSSDDEEGLPDLETDAGTTTTTTTTTEGEAKQE
eukprot:GEZU01011189.1.p2 GENE.GEZU01011189.1~~GEZU01011189.1.p2  ORF type:complete len:191 (-),score=103.62 GEZU01011189.1:33-605(-)